MPNRIIKESICTSDSVDCLSWFEEVLFYRLIVNCDDFGRFDGRTAVIKNRLFPLKDNLTLKNVESAINKLASAGLVVPYEAMGKPFLYLPTWNEHQTIRAKKSKYPEPEIICKQTQADASKCPRNPIQSNPNTNPNTNARNKRAKAFTPPTLAEVEAYCKERQNSVDAKRFYDFFSANDWKDSNGKPVQSWKQKVITWENYNNAPAKKADRFEAPTEEERESDMDLLRRMAADMERRSNAES